MADRDLPVGDDVVLLLEYAALIASVGRGDGTQLHALLGDGSEVAFRSLRNVGTARTVERVRSPFAEPRDDAAERSRRGHLAASAGPVRSPAEAGV